MSMRIYYKNSKNEILYLDQVPYKLLSKNSLFDYSWDYVTKGINLPRIAKFSKNMVKKAMTLVISGDTPSICMDNLNTLLAHIDIDVINLTKGRLYVGDYYLNCYITGSTSGDKYINTNKTTKDLTIVAERDGWIKETETYFGQATSEEYSGGGFDYPFDYPFDYGNSLTNQLLVNDSYSPSEFEMIIYGSCTNPAVSIDETTYEITTELLTGEYLVINSIDKTVYRVRNNGQKDNLFDSRNRDFNIFEKIPIDSNIVTWDGGFTFSITLFAERSEPKWS